MDNLLKAKGEFLAQVKLHFTKAVSHNGVILDFVEFAPLVVGVVYSDGTEDLKCMVFYGTERWLLHELGYFFISSCYNGMGVLPPLTQNARTPVDGEEKRAAEQVLIAQYTVSFRAHWAAKTSLMTKFGAGKLGFHPRPLLITNA